MFYDRQFFYALKTFYAMAFDSYCKAIGNEVETWDLSDKKVKQVYTLATKFIN